VVYTYNDVPEPDPSWLFGIGTIAVFLHARRFHLG
jgi:hypothetical protein